LNLDLTHVRGIAEALHRGDDRGGRRKRTSADGGRLVARRANLLSYSDEIGDTTVVEGCG
jgi:hypothetical protein